MTIKQARYLNIGDYLPIEVGPDKITRVYENTFVGIDEVYMFVMTERYPNIESHIPANLFVAIDG